MAPITWRFADLCRLTRAIATQDHPPVDIGGLSVMDLRQDRHLDHDQVQAVFLEAIGHLRDPDPSYLDLVRRNVAQINIYEEASRETVIWWSRHVNTPLNAQVRRNTFYLACRLVWAGAYFEYLSSVPWLLRRFRRNEAKAAAHEAWLSFVDLLPNSDEWRAYLGAHT